MFPVVAIQLVPSARPMLSVMLTASKVAGSFGRGISIRRGSCRAIVLFPRTKDRSLYHRRMAMIQIPSNSPRASDYLDAFATQEPDEESEGFEEEEEDVDSYLSYIEGRDERRYKC
jgi:hypothetical protein